MKCNVGADSKFTSHGCVVRVAILRIPINASRCAWFIIGGCTIIQHEHEHLGCSKVGMKKHKALSPLQLRRRVASHDKQAALRRDRRIGETVTRLRSRGIWMPEEVTDDQKNS